MLRKILSHALVAACFYALGLNGVSLVDVAEWAQDGGATVMDAAESLSESELVESAVDKVESTL